MPVTVDDARLGEYVTTVPQFRNDAHPLGYLEAGAPETSRTALLYLMITSMDSVGSIFRVPIRLSVEK